MFCRALNTAGIPVRAKIRRVVTRKLSFAYPVYLRGYEEQFRKIDACVSGFDGLVTFGRQGLFAHDNTHHALYMAYAAVECFNSAGEFNAARWRDFRRPVADPYDYAVRGPRTLVITEGGDGRARVTLVEATPSLRAG